MKYLHLLSSFAIAALLASCSSKKTEATPEQESDETIISASFEPREYTVRQVSCQPNMPLKAGGTFVDTKNLPQSLDTNMDISNLSYQELYLLRHYPYALKGVWFLDADLNKFYYGKASKGYDNWYYDLCEEIADASEEINDCSKVKLSKEHQEFVDKIDARMAQILAQTGWKEGEPMPATVQTCVNLFQIDDPAPEFLQMLQTWNVAFEPSQAEQLFQVYEMNDYQQMPSLITTDLYLQVTHMYFSYVLKSLEQFQFIPRLQKGVLALNSLAIKQYDSLPEGEQKQRAAFIADFFAIADALLRPNGKGKARAVNADAVKAEIDKIMAQADGSSEFLGTDYFAYSLFKPRGHYTRNEQSKRYFRAMMWLQSAPFCVGDAGQQAKAVEMAALFNQLPQADRDGVLQVFDILTFLMGAPDNVSVIEIAEYLKDNNLDPAKDQERINKHIEELAQTHGTIAPKVMVTCASKINFMPQRYTIDGDILNCMVDPTPNAQKAYPRGTDVFSVLGFDAAIAVADTCYHERENWPQYVATADSLVQKFSGFNQWNRSVYDKWLECLLSLQKADKNYPAFMQTTAWDSKNLTSALASWTTLKHDAVLYSKQPMTAECGGGCLSEPIVQGYVEPNVAFWEKLLELIDLNHTLLVDNKMLSEDLKASTESLKEKVQFCLEISQKELAGESLSPDDRYVIRHMGSSIDWLTLSLLDPENKPYCWEAVQGADREVALVADVYTRNVLGCNKNGIQHEGVGKPMMVYALVSVDGKCYLMRGATYSYHEFVMPLGERLTDEEWQQMLRDGKASGRPSWMDPYILNSEQKVNESIFYSSGC